MFLPSIAAVRARLGLAPPGSVLRDVYRSRGLNLVGVSEVLFPQPSDWPANVHLCGAFTLPERGASRELPGDLLQFLEAGPPPVYLTFGSMSAADPDAGATAALLADAARLASCRAIVQCGAREAAVMRTGDDLFVITGFVDHGLIFPRCAAVVHHGGSGTTQAASLAGRPSIVVPHATDQAFWAALLHRRGIAPRPLDRRTVTVRSLAGAIRSVLASGAMQERARSIGGSMKREDGVKRAVELIDMRYSRSGA
jgi:sterol 3beta-glucosyltransferase/vancomycin aglycone glucosyltransferase